MEHLDLAPPRPWCLVPALEGHRGGDPLPPHLRARPRLLSKARPALCTIPHRFVLKTDDPTPRRPTAKSSPDLGPAICVRTR